MKRIALGIVVAAISAWWADPVSAEVASVEITSRTDVLDGRAFGEAGAYEKISGTMSFRFAPENPRNARVTDIALAPVNEESFVEARTEFMVIQPVEAPPGGRTALVEVANRGRKSMLSIFNLAARSNDPVTGEDFGDGLLLRRGLTLVWLGWQWDVPDDPDLLRLEVPVARNADGTAISGLVRADWTVDTPTDTLPLAHRDHRAYPVADPGDDANVLTVRAGRDAERRIVPRDRWRFARATDDGVADDRTHIHMPGGFETGRIYELVYRAEEPRVVGLGLAAIRDVLSYMKHHPEPAFTADHGIAFGVSQTGRFLRHFLYQGFNSDEWNRPVYDGMLIHSAGAGRGSFNHRFAQPSRDGHRYSAFDYPTDLFPFTTRTQRDPVTGVRDGLLAHAHDYAHLPKIMSTNTGYEYWGRAASLLHTTPDGTADVETMEHERIYHFAGTQHFPWPFPPPDGTRLDAPIAAWRGNPADIRTPLRAALVNLLDWVQDDREPPTTSVPRIDARTLVPVGALRFPALPGIVAPAVAHEASRADYGPRWATQGIVDIQPPRLGPVYKTLVPQVDALGNERTGVRGLDLLVPLATYTPWHLRAGKPSARDELANFVGTFVPLPRTAAEATRTNDPRPPIDRTFPTKDHYRRKAEIVAERLVEARWMLEEDRTRAIERAVARWDWIHARQ